MQTLSDNLFTLRKRHDLTQEQVAHELGVSRQAVAKWETGETTPDLTNCLALAQFYDVSLDELVHYDGSQSGLPIPPKGKYHFGTVTVDEQGRILLPARARSVFHLHPGAPVVILGDEDRGLALLNGELMQYFLDGVNEFTD